MGHMAESESESPSHTPQVGVGRDRQSILWPQTDDHDQADDCDDRDDDGAASLNSFQAQATKYFGIFVYRKKFYDFPGHFDLKRNH